MLLILISFYDEKPEAEEECGHGSFHNRAHCAGWQCRVSPGLESALPSAGACAPPNQVAPWMKPDLDLAFLGLPQQTSPTIALTSCGLHRPPRSLSTAQCGSFKVARVDMKSISSQGDTPGPRCPASPVWPDSESPIPQRPNPLPSPTLPLND